MKIIDISWPISTEITEYKNKKTVTFEKIKTFTQDGFRESIISINSHTGTHIDAPSHFLKNGKTVDQIPLDSITGYCTVLDMTNVTESITRNDLQKQKEALIPNTIVLLKTVNSDYAATDSFNFTFISLDLSGAEFLQEQKIKAVGIDYLGIERGDPAHLTHTTLMKENIVIIEGLRLQNIKAGNYFFICLPLYTISLEAAPARAILITEMLL